MIDTQNLHWTLSNGVQTYDVKGFSMTNEYGCDTVVEGTFSGNITNTISTTNNTTLNDYLYPTITTSTCVVNCDYANNTTLTNFTIDNNGSLSSNWEY